MKHHIRKRDKDIYELRKTGKSFRKIGKEYNLSYERISQICRKLKIIENKGKD